MNLNLHLMHKAYSSIDMVGSKVIGFLILGEPFVYEGSETYEWVVNWLQLYMVRMLDRLNLVVWDGWWCLFL